MEKTNQNANLVSYDLVSEVIVALFGKGILMWRDYSENINLFSFNSIMKNYATVLRGMWPNANYLTSISLMFLFI